MKGIVLTAALLMTIIWGASAQHIKVVSFSEIEKNFRVQSDSIYVINFWATWCGPCVKELPYFDQLNAVYSDEPLRVILLSLDFPSRLKTTVIPFVKKKGIQSEVHVLNEKNMDAFIKRVSETWSGAIPATLIVNAKTGKYQFYEAELTYEELESYYQQIKP
jgi:thiol-disulfide isomerase/thioredoxin